LYNAHWISVCIIAVSESHEFLLKVRRLSSLFSTTTPTPSRRRVIIFSTTTQPIRLRRRVDVFTTTSGTSPRHWDVKTGKCLCLLIGPSLCKRQWREITEASYTFDEFAINAISNASAVHAMRLQSRMIGPDRPCVRDLWPIFDYNSLWRIDDLTFADILRLFAMSFQQNVTSHVFNLKKT